MRDRSILCALEVAALALLAVAPPRAAAQGKKDAYTAPRTPDGTPDLQGIWEVANKKANDALGKGVVVDPPDGKLPYKPEAVAKQKENFKNRVNEDPVNKCFIPGVPRVNYLNYPFQIFQTPKYIAIAYQYVHNYRTIYMDRKTHLDGIDFWAGDSIGHWEGETLVVDVGDFNDQTWFDKAGDYHSDALHVTERYTRTGPDTLQYEATIEDPNVYTKPWKISLEMRRNTQPNARILEFECQYLADEAAKKQPGK